MAPALQDQDLLVPRRRACRAHLVAPSKTHKAADLSFSIDPAEGLIPHTLRSTTLHTTHYSSLDPSQGHRTTSSLPKSSWKRDSCRPRHRYLIMTMTIDHHNQHRFGPLNFDMSSYSGHPHFTDPWHSSSASTGPGPHYVGSQNSNALPHLNLGALPKHPQHSQHPQHAQHAQHAQHSSRTPSSASMAPYGNY